MSDPSFEVQLELDGWELWWVRLQRLPGADGALAAVRSRTAERLRAEHELAKLGSHPTAAAVRRLFKAAGCDPSRYRPSSEALLRRLLKGLELPVIHPFVDLNNCLSAVLVVPCCVMPAGSFTPPVVLRAGRDGESFASLRGPFNLAGKPLLEDVHGPFGTPITDSERVKVMPEADEAWMVAYLPQGTVSAETAAAALDELLEQAPVARIR